MCATRHMNPALLVMYSETGNVCFHMVRASIGLVVSACLG